MLLVPSTDLGSFLTPAPSSSDTMAWSWLLPRSLRVPGGTRSDLLQGELSSSSRESWPTAWVQPWSGAAPGQGLGSMAEAQGLSYFCPVRDSTDRGCALSGVLPRVGRDFVMSAWRYKLFLPHSSEGVRSQQILKAFPAQPASFPHPPN